MKKDITYVSQESVIAVLTSKSGLQFEEKKGWLKVMGAKGRNIYVPQTKRVGRIDISGFEAEPTLAKVPHCGVFGNVKQQLRMDGDEAQILARLGLVIDLMLSLPARVKEVTVRAKKPAAPVADSSPDSLPVEVEPEPDLNAERLARIELIKKVAAEKGVSVSSKTMALASK